jgi:hypothetical protein
MFESSRSLVIFDHLRVPYAVRVAAENRLESLRPQDPARGARLLWPGAQALDDVMPRQHVLEGNAMFARVLDDGRSRELLQQVGGTWRPSAAIVDESGVPTGSVWRDDGGSTYFPFDPDEPVLSCWSERYESVVTGARARRLRGALLRSYYGIRPLLPRRVQIAARRRLAKLQARRAFPRWPVEPSLHEFMELVLAEVALVAGEGVPSIAAWPDGHTWAFVLTHDVETTYGYEHVSLMRDVECSLGLRSSWNFVPKRYDVDTGFVRRLAADGFEIGVHGLYHDGRDLVSEATLRERLPAMHEYAAEWGAVGFRSPATHRRWELMPLLGFDYDSSYPDSDPFEPMGGGCCSWLPYFNDELVELPITLVQDHTLFVILKRSDEQLWVDKAEYLRERGGQALLITHPDYMVDEDRLAAYRRLLERYADDPSAWHALPRDVSAWWRRRAASSVVRHGASWVVRGPAQGEGRIHVYRHPTKA